MVKKLNKYLLVITCILYAGCAIDYDDKSEEIQKSDEIPDSILVDFKLVKMKNNRPSSEVTSSKTEIYNDKNRTIMYDIKFLEYDKINGSVITTGSVDKVEYYNETEDAQLDGNLSFFSEKEGMELTGETLFWNSEQKTITSDDNIKIVKDDGSSIEGNNFHANLKNSTFSFKSSVKGINP